MGAPVESYFRMACRNSRHPAAAIRSQLAFLAAPGRSLPLPPSLPSLEAGCPPPNDHAVAAGRVNHTATLITAVLPLVLARLSTDVFRPPKRSCLAVPRLWLRSARSLAGLPPTALVGRRLLPPGPLLVPLIPR